MILILRYFKILSLVLAKDIFENAFNGIVRNIFAMTQSKNVLKSKASTQKLIEFADKIKDYDADGSSM